MASTAPAYTPLAPEQRRLLLAALSAYRKTPGPPSQSSDSPPDSSVASPHKGQMAATDGVSPSVFSNSASSFNNSNNNNGNNHNDTGLPLDFGSLDNTFNFDLDQPDDMGRNSIDDGFGGLLDSFDAEQQGEKRKSPGEQSDDEDDDENDPKRHEGEEKNSKKPGRKPLTSEPTTKRKAQNRAAQRAFRERKEKHLKDLETKVNDLEKASESANHENSILRAQVERLQDELKEYRRRTSVSGNGLNSSPTSTRPSMSSQRHTSANSIDDFDFNFDFSRFGDGSSLPANASLNNSQSPNVPRSTQRQATNHNDALGNMFGTGFFDGIGNNKNLSGSPQTFSSNDSPSAMNWASPANSNSNSSASRSPSTSNQNAASSSCCTSPDETNWAINYNKSHGDNPLSLANTPGLTHAKTPDSSTGNGAPGNETVDWLASQNGGSFDPVLFGDYRESQDNILGTGDFTGGFFEDTLPLSDFNDPFNFNTSADSTVPAPVSAPINGLPEKPGQKTTLLDKVAAQRDGGDEYDKKLVMPGETEKKQPSLMACYKIWNQLQSCPRFHSGDFDIDNLCSELASKAKCTETGLAIEKDKVEAALWKLAQDGSDAKVAA